MPLKRLSIQEQAILHSLIGREVQFFAQDVMNFAILGNNWQINIWSDNVYQGDQANFEVYGLKVDAESYPKYTPEQESHFAFTLVPTKTTIRDLRIVYQQWNDEWTVNGEPFSLRLEGGLIIDTDHGAMAALLEPYDIAYAYPFTSLNPSSDALDQALNAWSSRYELVSMKSLLKHETAL